MIYLLGGYMWLYVHRPFEVWPSLGALQIERAYMLIMILAWLVYPGKGFMPTRIHIALVLFGFAIIGAYVLSPYADMPGCWEVVDNFAKVAVFYVIVTTTVRDEKTLRLLLLLFLGAVTLYVAHSIAEYMAGRYQHRMGVNRMVGVDVTFGDPNAFATTLLYTLPLLVPFWWEQPRRVPRVAIIGYALMVLGCIMLTGSRAGFAGMCVFLCMLIVSEAKRKVQAVLLLGLVAMAGFLVLSVVLPEDLQNRYLTLVDSTKGPENAQVSASGRLDGFLFGIKVWQESPMFGYGPASFAYSTGRGGQAHNLYGQVLSELGLAGAVALLAMVVCFALNWWEARRRALEDTTTPLRQNFSYQVSRAIGFNIILLLVMGWAGHNLFRYNWQWFAAFSAIALHCLRTQSQQVASSVAEYGQPAQYGYGAQQG